MVEHIVRTLVAVYIVIACGVVMYYDVRGLIYEHGGPARAIWRGVTWPLLLKKP